MSTTQVGRAFRFVPQNTQKDAFTHWFSMFCARMSGLTRLENMYGELAPSENARGFIAQALQKLGVSYSVSDEDLQRIPQEGPLIVVANHPYGGLDGLILGDILLSRRADVKIMANYMLGCVRELRELLLFVDPYAQTCSVQSNRNALKHALAHLRGGGVLGVFPAGDVAHFSFRSMGVREGEWSTQMARFIRHSQAAVLPVFFEGGNGPLFHTLGLLHPRMRTVQLPREIANKHGRRIRVEIGGTIPASRLESVGDDKRCMNYLRMRSLILRRRAEKPGPKLFPMKMKTRQAKLIEPIPGQSLAVEMNRLPKNQILFENGEFIATYARAEQIPLIMCEISRLREHTFRLVNEGTGKGCDIDEFDAYYIHIFLWNREQNEIVGAYRLAHSDEVLRRLGERGMYTATLFKLAPDFFRRLGPALEMGRSFVRPEYQKSYAPLLMLWKGIAAYILKFPEYKILFGPVSITNDYKNVSRQLMASFFESRNSQKELASLVSARIPFRCRSWVRALTRNMPDDEMELASMLGDIEAGKGLPVLIRQYLKLGGAILRFNLDPAFSNALDGLIVVDLLKSDKKQLERYMGKEGAGDFLAYHQRREYPDIFEPAPCKSA
ncbi:MAG: lysophospholipid acyltransferase family protein [Syntrophorhabdaceae bacterium]|nr:lysophospholipid acyltransferase family protein [Syntrophorhabdaceae bacterium]